MTTQLTGVWTQFEEWPGQWFQFEEDEVVYEFFVVPVETGFHVDEVRIKSRCRSQGHVSPTGLPASRWRPPAGIERAIRAHRKKMRDGQERHNPGALTLLGLESASSVERTKRARGNERMPPVVPAAAAASWAAADPTKLQLEIAAEVGYTARHFQRMLDRARKLGLCAPRPDRALTPDGRRLLEEHGGLPREILAAWAGRSL